MWPSAQRLGKGYQSKLLVSEAYLSAMTGDCHDELAALDLSMTTSLLVRVLTVMPVWLFFIIPVLFLNTKQYILHEC